MLTVMTNPRRKHRNSRRRRANARRSRKSNPIFMKSRSRRHRSSGRRRRSNPFGGVNADHLLKLGIGGAAGGIGSRYIAQAVLGANNTGFVGYAADAAIGVALYWGAKKFAGQDIADGVAAGAFAALLLRIANEQFGVAAPASMNGYLGDMEMVGLGAYLNNGYPLPPASQLINGALMNPTLAAPTAAPAGTVAMATKRQFGR